MSTEKILYTSDYYKSKQDWLNARYSHRVEAWLSHFKVDYAWKVIHIIEWPRESKLPWRQGHTSTLARFLGVWAKIKFSVGWTTGECPSFKPASMKATKRRVELIKKRWFKLLIMEEISNEIAPSEIS